MSWMQGHPLVGYCFGMPMEGRKGPVTRPLYSILCGPSLAIISSHQPPGLLFTMASGEGRRVILQVILPLVSPQSSYFCDEEVFR